MEDEKVGDTRAGGDHSSCEQAGAGGSRRDVIAFQHTGRSCQHQREHLIWQVAGLGTRALFMFAGVIKRMARKGNVRGKSRQHLMGRLISR